MKIISLFVTFFSLLACTPTGPGVCNVGVAGLVQGNGNLVSWNWLRIYNNACQEIGGVNGVFVNYLPVSVASKLPYVLILDYLSYKNYNHMEFRYSSHTFKGTPYCQRHTIAGGSVIQTCQSAFNC
ncbi:hypothetical protein V8F06_011185 [Rhypophila decipiens]